MASPLYMPDLIAKLGGDLSIICHAILERAYPVFYAWVALAEGCILVTVILRGRNPEKTAHSGTSSNVVLSGN